MKYGLTLCALTTFIGATIATAYPAPSPAPVTINSCQPDLSRSSNPPTIAGVQLSSTSSGIRIEFVNESSKVADLVNFDVDSNGTQFVIRDVGTFSPGVSIVHRYRNGAGQSFVLPSLIAPKIKCRVASVKFTDGTLWTRNQPPPDGAPPASGSSGGKLTATPAKLELSRSTESDLFLVKSTEPVTAFKETDTCSGIASIFVAATGESSATYSIKPVSPGSCAAIITDEAGNSLSIPVVVH